MVHTYVLVNPHIEGEFKSSIKARNSKEAGNILYKSLSEHFNNAVPKFHFTVQKGSSGSGKYYHFEAKEQRDDNQVNFVVKPLEANINSESIKAFESKLANFKSKFHQDGGKKSKKSKKSRRYDDSSDSSDFDVSETNFYKRARSYLPTTQPIYYWWYDPYVYRLDTLYVPTFYSYVTPYIELSLDISKKSNN